MTRIVNIDALLPDDAVLQWRGQEWRIPGDLSVEAVLGLQKAASSLQGVSTAEQPDPDAVVGAMNGLAHQVAAVLAIRQPERAAGLTFGARELGVLAGTIVALASGAEVKPQAEAQGESEGNAETAVAQ